MSKSVGKARFFTLQKTQAKEQLNHKKYMLNLRRQLMVNTSQININTFSFPAFHRMLFGHAAFALYTCTQRPPQLSPGCLV